MHDTVVMGIRNQLQNIVDNFKVISSYSQLKNIPVIIGESDPEGCAACGMATNPENAYRNGTMYSSYEAAVFPREYELAKKFNTNLIGAVTWAFEFENQPWFYGYRDLATNGVDKPVLNVFRMFGMMKGKEVTAVSDNQYTLQNILDSGVRKTQTDVGALAAATDSSAAIMIWNYHDVDKKNKTANVLLNINGISNSKIKVIEYRIDEEHSNAYTLWKKMHSPQNPTAKQINALEKAGQLQQINKSKSLDVTNGILILNTALPEQAVSLFKLSW
jgi:xylan 1,4-beta-xylosidase